MLIGPWWGPQLVTPTPTLSLVDRVSRCKPQAPCGFSRVIGSGLASPCPGQAGGGPWAGEGLDLPLSCLSRG